MALEDLVGDRYINALLESNPVGATDAKSFLDEHLRGMKNVLKKTFPGIIGPVTATQSELNNGYAAYPSGTKSFFIQAAAPSGWTQDVTYNDMMLRVVNTAGGGLGGSWTISGATVGSTVVAQAQLPTHAHTGAFSGGTHEHTFPVGVSGAYTGTMPDETTANDSVTWTETTSTTGAHLHTFTTGGTGGGTGHTHSLTMGALWRPSYVDVICCIRV